MVNLRPSVGLNDAGTSKTFARLQRQRNALESSQIEGRRPELIP